MKKSIFSAAAVALALTLAVSAIPTSAAEDAKAKPEFTEILDLAEFPTDTAVSSDNNVNGVNKYISVGDAGKEQSAKDGKWDAKIVEIEKKKSIEFDSKSLTEGLYLEADATTSIFGGKKGSLPLGKRAKNGAETLNIEFDASDCNDANPYLSFVIWEYAKDGSGKGFADDKNTSFSVGFWKLVPNCEVVLTDSEGTEVKVNCNNQNIPLPKGFKGFATIKISDLQLDWGSATWNKDHGCTRFYGDNILKTTLVTSLNKDGGQFRVGGFYLGYNGYKPGMKDATEVKMIDAKIPKEACDNKDFEAPAPTTSEAAASTAPKVEESKAKDQPATTDTTSKAKTADTTSKAKTTGTKTKTPVTGDAGAVALAGVLLVSAGAAFVISKRK